MTAHLSLIQIAGINGPTYEEFYKEVNPDEFGNVTAIVAAKFLKRSGLSDPVLSRIWDMSDTNCHGFLSKQEFFIALKLVSLAQNGQDISVSNITLPMISPKLTTSSPSVPTLQRMPSGQSAMVLAWTVKPDEKTKYDGLFDSLQPIGNKLPGDKVKPVLINTKLPFESLSKIWDLSDIDKDGSLDRDEFALAMHLVYKALHGEQLPASLSLAQTPPNKRPQPAGMDSGKESRAAGVRQVEWVVRPDEKYQYEALFIRADRDKDGFVSGIEIKDTFLQSGLPQHVLAKIWDLCDIRRTGLLNNEQFALAMHLIKKQLTFGVSGNINDLPAQPTQEMIPPSLRSGSDRPSAIGGPAEISAEELGVVRESDKVYEEIEAIKKQRSQLDEMNVQLEMDVAAKTSDVQSMTRQLDRAADTEAEAVRWREDFQANKARLEAGLAEIREKCAEEKTQADQLKGQLDHKQMSIKGQEENIAQLRSELNELMREESSLQDQVQENQRRLLAIETETKQYAGQLERAQGRIGIFDSNKSQLQQVLEQYTALLNGDTSVEEPDVDLVQQLTTADLSASIEPVSKKPAMPPPPSGGFGQPTEQHGSARAPPARPPPVSKTAPPPLPSSGPTAAPNDPFANDDPFKSNDKADDAFNGSDPFGDAFGSDPFKEKSSKDKVATAAGFSSDPFEDLFSKAPANKVKASVSPAFGSDPFASDAFGEQSGANSAFDSGFGDSKDPFGADPFAPSAAKPNRPKSPCPPRPGKSPGPSRPEKSESPGSKKIPPRPTASPVPQRPPSRPTINTSAAFPTSSSTSKLDPFDPFATPQPGADFNFSAPTQATTGAAASDPFGFADFANFDAPDGGGGFGAAFGGASTNTNNTSGGDSGAVGDGGEQDLNWATEESKRVAQAEEKMRRQEEEELQMALRLSEMEAKGK